MTEEIFHINSPPAFEDLSCRSYEYHEFFPVDSNNSLNVAGNINIVVQQQGLITHPYEAYLYFEGELKKRDNSAFGEDASLVNNSMMYLFNNITYLINEQEVENVNNPGQTSTMLGLLKYRPDDERLGMGWLLDTTYDAEKKKFFIACKKRI